MLAAVRLLVQENIYINDIKIIQIGHIKNVKHTYKNLN